MKKRWKMLQRPALQTDNPGELKSRLLSQRDMLSVSFGYNLILKHAH
jgi:hypothetical protein